MLAKINRWDTDLKISADDTLASFFELFQVIKFHSKRFDEYHPTQDPCYPDFLGRLPIWLENVPDEKDQRVLFRLVPNIVFFGSEEFKVMYRSAFQKNVLPWLMDTCSVDFRDRRYERILSEAIDTTWFCPITDSFVISQFYHLNRIAHREDRPDWRGLIQLGAQNEILSYIRDNSIERIVLLEDFVGTGEQIEDTVLFAANEVGLPTLIVPLVLCPEGARRCSNWAAMYPTLRFASVLLLAPDTFIKISPVSGEPPEYANVRDLSHRLLGAEAFGFRGMGALVVNYTNCPDNSLLIIHLESQEWKPLFPRAPR